MKQTDFSVGHYSQIIGGNIQHILVVCWAGLFAHHDIMQQQTVGHHIDELLRNQPVPHLQPLQQPLVENLQGNRYFPENLQESTCRIVVIPTVKTWKFGLIE